ncbi:unnamed protein product [Toxocara canis]|uniref:Uncharacterized protein n=1 Tax=Toxocara canis TaxID=6265 RepID=A0A183VC96_TOXCA|nr:unnamed protein product [Toxocara canis]
MNKAMLTAKAWHRACKEERTFGTNEAMLIKGLPRTYEKKGQHKEKGINKESGFLSFYDFRWFQSSPPSSPMTSQRVSRFNCGGLDREADTIFVLVMFCFSFASDSITRCLWAARLVLLSRAFVYFSCQ